MPVVIAITSGPCNLWGYAKQFHRLLPDPLRLETASETAEDLCTGIETDPRERSFNHVYPFERV